MIAAGEVVDGRYRVDRRLGRGGMAEVFAATDVRLGRAVAIKVLRFDDTAARDRFEREMRLLARLDHPGLVRVFDAGEDGDDAFFVMEMVEGDTLAERLAAGPLATEETAKLGAAVADALAFIHADGVVHRDVKPSNILLGRDDRPRLADFGIARLTDATALTSTGLTVGTAAYIAPEQFVGQRAEPPADIYALALVLCECATGRRVFRGTPAEITAQRLAGPPPMPTDLDPALRPLLSAMLAADPSQRPTAAQVAAHLERGATADAAPTLPLAGPAAPTTVNIATRPIATVPPTPNRRQAGPGRSALVAAWITVAAIVLAAIVLTGRGHHHKPTVAAPPPTTATTSPPSTTPPSTSPPTTAAPTFTQVLNQIDQTVASATTSQQIKAPVANDLTHRLQDLAQHQQAGAPDLAHQVSDLAMFVSDQASHGQIDAATAQMLTRELTLLETINTLTAPHDGPGPGARLPPVPSVGQDPPR